MVRRYRFRSVCVCVCGAGGLGRGDVGAQYINVSPLSPAYLYFFRKKIAHKLKVQKYNINKICQTELRLKEMLNDNC